MLAFLLEHELVVNPARVTELRPRVEAATPPDSWFARLFWKPTPAFYDAIDGLSMDSVWLFDAPESITHTASAQARWDACVLAESLIEDQAWVLATSPDMDAPDFDTILEVAVRERILPILAASRNG